MNKLLTTISFLIASSSCVSQNFIVPGIVWYYSADLVNNTSGYQSLHYQSDTIIGKFSYKKIENQMIILDKRNQEYSRYGLDKIFIRQSNDTIYCLNKQGKDRFAWHLNPKPGDVWYFGECSDISTFSTKKVYTRVDSVVNTYFNGISSKNIYSTPNVDSLGKELNESDYFYPLYIKKINTICGPQNYFSNISNLERTQYIDGNLTNKILCFGSNQFPIYKFDKKNCFNNIDK